ncbi:transposase [Streptomyces sp. NPDC005774]|uniref:transposase n=1 Tax=Streptomyces sp. NPDC005774 TaxID=3364728 RepID=UPI0036ADB08F
MFDDETLTRCEEIMRTVCEDLEAEPKEPTGGHDHVRLLVHHPPKVAVSTPVSSLKGVSARRTRLGHLPAEGRGRVHRPHQPRLHAWTPALALILLGILRRAPSAITRRYIEQRNRPFQRARQSSPEMRESPGVNAGAFTQDHR